MATCAGITKAGVRCKKLPVKGGTYCAIHGKSVKPSVVRRNIKQRGRTVKKIKQQGRTVKKTKQRALVKKSVGEMPMPLGEEVVIFNLLLSMDPPDLNNACNTNIQFAKICNTEYFKRSYVKKWGELLFPSPLAGEKFVRTRFRGVFKSQNHTITTYADGVRIRFGPLFTSDDFSILVLDDDEIQIDWIPKLPKRVAINADNYTKYASFGIPLFDNNGKISKQLKSDRSKKLFKQYNIDYLLTLDKRRVAANIRRIAGEAVKGL